jgi:serine phosphatase RsbU (regulator of sigma subunit)
MPLGVPREDAVSARTRASVPPQNSGAHERTGTAVKDPLTLLVIEDDLAGGRSVPGILDAAGGYLPGDAHRGASAERIKVRTARNLTEAERLLTDDVQCILLDLALTGAGVRRSTGARKDTGGRRDAGVAGASSAGGAAGSTGAAGPYGSGGSGSGAASSGPVSGAGTKGPGSAAASASGSAAAAEGAPSGEGETDATGELEILRHVLRLAPLHAVIALTDGADAERAAEAVRVGAQDYLFRDELDGRLLNRAIRYAVERKRADLAQRQLTESRLRAQENARLERGLLPTPLLSGSELHFAARYRPGRSRALLGGDFYDTVRTADGTVHAMIGDVCGHGPDEAALGVELRIAWRALTFAGLCGDELLGTLQKVLDNERASDEIFATLCTVDIAPDGRRAGVCLAGHPSPLVAGASGSVPRLLPYDYSGPALGVVPNARWPRRQVELGRAWSLLMYTDGLIEGHVGEGRRRLGQDGMIDIVTGRMAQGIDGERLLDATMEDVRRLNGGELTDDVAVLLLNRQ